MTPILAYALITHVISGILAIGLIHLLFMHFLRKSPSWNYLQYLSVSATLLLIISWITSAYYYVSYYGKEVKPRIVGGNYPWAHQIFMEAKEHVFILIPFLSITLLFLIFYLGKKEDVPLKNMGVLLAFITLILGAFVAVSGVLVSGSVR